MNIIAFNEIILKTAFCCMASDGHIDEREVSQIKNMCKNTSLFDDISIQDHLNQMVVKINENSIVFIRDYFAVLENANFTEEEELAIINFAIKTIMADHEIEYSEIKFFKNIRHRLKVSDDKILAVFPDIGQFLEEDIITESFLDKITNQYLEAAVLPQFELINIDNSSFDDFKKDE
jgi:uncharacterized tellurite resistance protein B-like protein